MTIQLLRYRHLQDVSLNPRLVRVPGEASRYDLSKTVPTALDGVGHLQAHAASSGYVSLHEA